MDQSSSPVRPVSPEMNDRADDENNSSDDEIHSQQIMDTEDDAWSRHIEADAISEGGRMSTTASLLNNNGDADDADQEDEDQEDTDRQGVDMIHPLVTAEAPPPPPPPSSVAGAASTTDHDEDDDWSRQEHAVLVAAAASAATTGSNTTIAVEEGLTSSSVVAPPLREEPTLKEKLVERERQRRVETERARLKRQFALRNENSNNEESVAEGGGGADEEYHHDDDDDDEDNHMMRENGSVAGTVGEGSIVAPVDVLMEDDQSKQMNYPMERFLQEQGTITEEETIRESIISSSKRDTQNNQGVVMERFLQEPVVVEPASSSADDGINDSEQQQHRPSTVDRSVSFDMEPPHSLAPDSPRLMDRSRDSTPEGGATTPPRSQEGDYNTNTSAGNSIINTARDGSSYLANASMDCVTSDVIRISDLGPTERSTSTVDGTVDNDSIQPSPGDHHALDTLLPPESPTMDQPRLLGLTLAEIEELAAIEEVSQQNAPPSERDDLSASSFVAELVSDFGGHGNDHHHHTGGGGTTLSQGTPTTAMESASIVSGNQSARPSSTVSETGDDRQSMNELDSDGGGASVAVNPPSELGHEDTLLSPLADHHILSPLGDPHRSSNSNDDNNAPALPIHPSIPHIMNRGRGPDDLSDLATLNQNAGIVNRQIRPGMISAQQGAELRQQNNHRPAVVRRVMSMPDKMDFEDLDGFDYDKNAPASPATDQFARIRDVSGDDLWSPGSKLSVERSPFRPRTVENIPPRPRSPPDFARESKAQLQEHGVSSETDPLMPDIPSEIVTNSRASTKQQKANLKEAPPPAAASASDIGAVTITPTNVDSRDYMQSSLLQRAFPKRIVALAVTCLVEVPVLLMIVGGSDRLCSLLGRSTYQFLMGLLPLCSAISGNLGLQTSTLTAQSLSNGQLTKKNCIHWLVQEIGTAAVLGLATGVFVGLVAFVMSGFNLIFGLAIMVAQGMSMLTAGLTGSLPPLFFSFLLERTAGQWSGLMETAVQDVVSTFVMVVITYKMLEFCGPFQIDPSDMCHVQPS